VKRIIKKINSRLFFFGFNPIKTARTIAGLPFYFNDLRKIKKQKKKSNNKWKFGSPYPILDERFSSSGTAKGHYFHQDLLFARRIFANQPKIHVDVGSRIDGFVAHVASFRQIEVIDIRHSPNETQNIKFIQADIMEPIPTGLINYSDSLSSLCAVEHFGLGRYNDPVNYEGYIIGLNNMYKIIKTGGKFYFSVPIGPQRIEFNGHRIFSLVHLFELFENKYSINHFSYVDDKGDLHEDIKLTDENINNNCNCNFGSGIFEMTKI